MNDKRRMKRIIKFSIIVSIFEFLARYIDILFKLIFINDYLLVDKEEQNSHFLISIIFKYILSIIILHYPFYRHHYFSMGINIICLIAIVILDILNMVDGKLKYPHVITKTLIVLLYSFEDVIEKFFYLLILFHLIYIYFIEE